MHTSLIATTKVKPMVNIQRTKRKELTKPLQKRSNKRAREKKRKTTKTANKMTVVRICHLNQ